MKDKDQILTAVRKSSQKLLGQTATQVTKEATALIHQKVIAYSINLQMEILNGLEESSAADPLCEDLAATLLHKVKFLEKIRDKPPTTRPEGTQLWPVDSPPLDLSSAKWENTPISKWDKSLLDRFLAPLGDPEKQAGINKTLKETRNRRLVCNLIGVYYNAVVGSNPVPGGNLEYLPRLRELRVAIDLGNISKLSREEADFLRGLTLSELDTDLMQALVTRLHVEDPVSLVSLQAGAADAETWTALQIEKEYWKKILKDPAKNRPPKFDEGLCAVFYPMGGCTNTGNCINQDGKRCPIFEETGQAGCRGIPLIEVAAQLDRIEKMGSDGEVVSKESLDRLEGMVQKTLKVLEAAESKMEVVIKVGS